MKTKVKFVDLNFSQEYINKLLIRFLKSVDIEKGGCWVWNKFKDKDGYGVMYIRANGVCTSTRAHRIAYLLFVEDPGRLFVCHTCDNPSCCNPAHLFAGTASDNMQDMIRKGRQNRNGGAKGTANNNAKLTNEKVREIRRLRAEGRTYKSLSEEFGVNLQGIFKIVSRKRWKHVK